MNLPLNRAGTYRTAGLGAATNVRATGTSFGAGTFGDGLRGSKTVFGTDGASFGAGGSKAVLGAGAFGSGSRAMLGAGGYGGSGQIVAFGAGTSLGASSRVALGGSGVHSTVSSDAAERIVMYEGATKCKYLCSVFGFPLCSWFRIHVSTR